MSEEDVVPAPANEDQPEVSAPDAGTSAEVAPFDEGFDPSSLPDELQDRYRQMQGDYTRKTQDLADQRKQAEQATSFLDALQSDSPDQQAFAIQSLANALGPEVVLNALGYEADDPDAPDLGQEEVEPVHYDPRVDQLLEEKESAEFEARLEAIETDIRSKITSAGEFTPEEQELLFNAVLASEPKDNAPDVAGVVAQYQAVIDGRIKDYRDTKRGAPAAPLQGVSGVPAPDLTNQKSRLAFANEVAQRSLDSSG